MKRTVAAILLSSMMISALSGSFTFSVSADERKSTTKEETLFFTSFESQEKNGLLLSTPDGQYYSNLEYVAPVSNTKGLAVDLSTVGGSADFKSSEGKLCLFDGDVNTKFLTESTRAEVYFKLEKSAIVDSFSIASANDAPERDPKSIALYGSCDGSSWQRIYSTGISFSERYEEKTVNITSNTTAYAWYKLEVSQNNGSSNMTQFSELCLYGKSVESEEEDNKEQVGNSPLSTLRGNGPSSSWCNYTSVGWTGFGALTVSSKKTDKEAYGRNVIFDGLNIPVSDITKLSYVIFPALKNTDYDYYYTSMHLLVDLKFTDGSYLSSLGAKDHNGMEYTPEGQAHGEALFTMQWNYVEVDLASVAKDKTIEQILVYFDMKDGATKADFVAYFDDIKIENKAEITYEHLSDYIDIRRGTNNNNPNMGSPFSRGLTTPGVATPNGFNFYTPVTDPTNNQVCYKYQLAKKNNTLDSISVMHVPSNWIASWGSWQFMANTSVDTSSGAGAVKQSDITSDKRKAEFTHEKEIARAHYYSVLFEEGSAASGVKMEITPTSHGAYVRFTFPEGSDNVNVIFDSLWENGSVKIAEDGSFTASTEPRDNPRQNGCTKMYVYGVFDTPVSSSKSFGDGSGVVAFAKGTAQVTMKLATSYISASQAEHSLELEVGNKNFDGVYTEAQKAWDDLCSRIEIEGATYTEKVTFYSCMYRLYAYPTLYSENEGTNEAPKWVHANPYKGGKKTSGKMYVSNGFWDTYRTAWAGYGLLTPELDGELLDGLVQHYIDQGWVPRWIAPGGVNSMVGTSSDVIFADAYAKGLSFDFENAYLSMLKNASVVSLDLQNGGRKETETSVFKGYVSNSTDNGYSWTMEGFINDFGLYIMSERLGKTDEAEYYKNRCLKYVEMFNKEADFFMGKNESGQWSSSASSYNPAVWWGDYTEASGWIMAFTAVYDGNGLANLYGGKEAFAKKLDAFFADDVDAMKKVATGSIHEMMEAREVRMGQYAHNNQPSHHIAYMYSFTDEPYKTQALTRTVLKKLYVGSEIGQGYCGDEDNGEMSAWYMFSAMGLYPLSMGSGEYVFTSPLFDKVTIHLENGKDIVISAQDNSDENVYIQSMKINGKDSNSLVITHEELTKGAQISVKMGKDPSKWGTKAYEEQSSLKFVAPSSLTQGDKAASPLSDIVTGRVKVVKSASALNTRGNIISQIKDAQKLFDDTGLTQTAVKSGDSIIFASSAPRRISMITLTSYASSRAVKGFKLEASNDGEGWMTLDQRSELKFEWNQYTRPFAIPEEKRGMYLYYRLTFDGASKMELAEIEFLGVEGEKADITPITPDSQTPGTPDGGEQTVKPSQNNKMALYIIVAVAALAVVALGGAGFVIIRKRTKAK